MTTIELKDLFSDLDKNLEEIIEIRLDEMEHRMEELEKLEQHRDILALCQEYYEWGTCKNGEDYELFWLENLIEKN